MTKTISVIVPTHGRPGLLRRAIDSILGQTLAAHEIIVVDDNPPASPEAHQTRAILESCVDNTQVHVVHSGGAIGGGAARNLGVRHASGEYLAFLDDDDVFLPDKLHTQLSFMAEHALDMSYQDVEWYDAAGRLVERRILDHAEGSSQMDLLRAHLRTPLCPTSIFMIKRESFHRTDGFGEGKTGQDWLLMMRCIEAGLKIAYMPGVHVHQYLHDGPRLSIGRNKVDGEEVRHEMVRSYYPLLSPEDIKYIEFRHNAVLAVAARRSLDVRGALTYGARALRISPTLGLREGLRFASNRRHRRGEQ